MAVRIRTAALALAAIAATVAPGVSLADAPIGVVVVDDDGRVAPDAAARRLVGVVGDAELVRPQPPAAPVDDPAALAALDDELARGWRRYLAAEVEAAREVLSAALRGAVAHAVTPAGRARLAELALRLGVVLAHLGDGDATAHLRLALRLAPARTIGLDEFSPDVVAAVDAARAAAPPRASLSIAVTPADATVEIDGAAPTGEVEVGLHLVTATAPGLVPEATLARVETSGAAVELTPAVDREAQRVARGLRQGDPSVATAELLAAIGRRRGVAEVVVVATSQRRRGPVLLGQRCQLAPAVRCTDVVEVAAAMPDAVAAQLAAELWRELRERPIRALPSLATDPRLAPEAPVPPRPPARCAACRSPWLWGGVGAALLAGVVAALVFDGDAPPRGDVEIDPGEF
ncbi:MAG: hypothetical protein R2939_12350 [Kofleriaceae bacterium]